MGSSAAGIGALATAIGSVAVMPLGCVAIGCGILSAATRLINRKLESKAKKHNSICVLAESKLNTISNHVAKALQDGNIDHLEFNMITEEFDKYNKLKSDIRKKPPKQIPDQSKKREMIKKLLKEELNS